VALPDEEAIELWIVDGRISREPVSALRRFRRWLGSAGLVDAHCHVGLGLHGAIDLDEASRRPRPNAGRRAVAAALRLADRHPQPRRP